MLNFLDVLKEKMAEFMVEGRIQWRVSGRYWQDDYPEFFESAKVLKPIRVKKEINIKDWLIKIGFDTELREHTTKT
jgi:hypothetical protein